MTSVKLAQRGHIATLTLGSPSTRNALDEALRAEFATAIESLNDDDDVRVVIVAGANGVFASGLYPLPEGPAARGAGSAVASLRKPTIAWIDGACVDMGLELALACDVRIASATSTFGLRGVQHGQLPWDGGTQRLSRAVGRGHALRLLLTGAVVGAEEALRIELVEGIGDAQAVADWAERAAAGAPIAAAYTKEATASAHDLTLGQGLRLEADLSVLLQSTADRAEGLDSFASKRKSRFDGR
jgi:enoyl-CoA hydratase/carnithine racemase